MRHIRYSWTILFTVLALTSYTYSQRQNSDEKSSTRNREPVVVFVCEHGAAKSIVAAAHFNKLAREKGLKLRAVARGTHPDEEINPTAARGLQAVGLAPGEPKPKSLTNRDMADAVRVVTFNPLPEEYKGASNIVLWNDVPPFSEGYDKSRDAIVNYIKLLIDDLKRTGAEVQ